MKPWHPIAGALWWLALIVWVAVIAASGTAAMVAFTRLPELGVVMPGTEAFFGDDTAAAGRFVAGYVTNPIFVAGDWIRLGAAAIAWLAIAFTGFRPVPGDAGRIIAIVLLGVATLILAWSVLGLAPALQSSLAEWRAAVLADDPAAAEIARERFDPLHVKASGLMRIELLLILAAAACGGAASTGRRRKGRS